MRKTKIEPVSIRPLSLQIYYRHFSALCFTIFNWGKELSPSIGVGLVEGYIQNVTYVLYPLDTAVRSFDDDRINIF